MNWEQIGKWAGAVTALIVLAAAVLWGVPHYIKVQVRAEVTAELEAQEVSTELDELEDLAKGNAATLTAINTRLGEITQQNQRRNELFEAYLERQANRER